MSTVRDMLERRRAEIRKEMQPLEASSLELRTKLSSIDAKLKTLSIEAGDIEKALQVVGKREPAKTEITIKDAILDVLATSPNGLTSSELLDKMNEKFFGGALVRTSMSPQITRLKNKDQKIRQRGERYFLA